MNDPAFALAAVLVVLLLVEHLADFLNLRTLRRPLPDRFRPVFDETAYAKLQRYTADSCRFGIVESTFHLAVLLTFWFCGGFGWLDGVVRAAGWGGVMTGLLYISLLWLGRWVVGLPFDLYDTFGIEQRHGFNRTGAGLFWADALKSLLLSAGLGLPLAALVLALFLYAGPFAWLIAWGAVAAVLLLITYLAPAWILPLFYKFEPLPDGELRSEILDYARRNEFPLSEISVMDGSRRSTKSNAFFTGFGKRKRVALYDTLVERQTVPELVAVLAHEIGHYRKGHIPRRIAATLAGLGLYLWLLSLALEWPGLYTLFGVDGQPIYAGLVVFGILLRPLQWVLGIVSAWISRRHEFEADRFAAETTGSGEALANALRKLSQDNLTHLEPHPFYVALHHSHPPVLERIAALDAMRGG